MNRPACDPLRHSHHGQNQPSPACPGCSSPCPACGYPEYGCPGHGVSRDPLGWSILNRHEVADHSSCHIAAACHVGAVAVVHDPIVHERGEITCTGGTLTLDETNSLTGDPAVLMWLDSVRRTGRAW